MTSTLMPMVSHDEKPYVTPHFDHLDLRNSIVLFMMLLLPCNANASMITWPKSYVALHFDLLHSKEFNGAIYSAIRFIVCDANARSVTWLKKPCMLHYTLVILTSGMEWYPWKCCQHHLTLMQKVLLYLTLTWPKELSSAIYNAISIMCCWC